ncbi:MAG: PD40 domain-containing protein [Acidobacteria bacterium]|nr:PD40 domain-containing protein [Acidobacteriota bacterium]
MAVYQLEDLQVDSNTMELRRGREVVDMEPKSFRLLVHLIENRARVVPKEELMERIWNGAAVTDNSLTRSVAQIRKALGDDARQSRFVETVPTVGYRFIGAVEELVNPAPIGEPLNPNPKINWWVPLAAITAIAASFLMPYIRLWTSSTKPPPRAVQFTTSSGLDMNPSFSPDGSSVTYTSDRTGSFEIYVKQVQNGGAEVAITADGKNNLEPSWSPDGASIAYYCAAERSIYVVSSLGGQPRKLTDFGSQPVWSLDSKRVYFRSESMTTPAFTGLIIGTPSTIWSVPIHGGRPEAITQPGKPTGRHSDPHSSPKSDHVAFLSMESNQQSSLWEMDAKQREPMEIQKGPPHAYDFTYAADGLNLFLLASDGKSLGIYFLKRDPATRKAVGKPELLTPVEYVHLRNLAASPKGNRLAYSATTMTSNLWQTTTDGHTQAVTQESTYRMSQPVFSPDGTRIAYFLRTHGQYGDIHVIGADGKNPKQITSNPGGDYLASWSADGTAIYYASVRGEQTGLYRYSLADGLETMVTRLDNWKSLARISPDGQKMVFHRLESGQLGTILRDVSSGKETLISPPGKAVGFPSWSPDGKSIGAEMFVGDSSHTIVIPLSGGEPVQVTNRSGHAWIFSFSPDSSQVAYAALWGEPWNIFTQPIAGNGPPRKLTDNKLFRIFLRYPAWSPDGKSLVYERNETKGNLFLAELEQ